MLGSLLLQVRWILNPIGEDELLLLRQYLLAYELGQAALDKSLTGICEITGLDEGRLRLEREADSLDADTTPERLDVGVSTLDQR